MLQCTCKLTSIAEVVFQCMWIKLLWLEIELEPEELNDLLRHLALLAAFSTLVRLLVLYSNRPDFLQHYG